jgi:hypothetical protein
MAQTATQAPVKASAVDRTGTALTIASAVILAVPLVYVGFAYMDGSVTLSSADAISRLFTVGIILTALAGILGLIATVIHGMAARKGITTGKGAQLGVSALVAVIAALFLLTTVMPRAGAIQSLNDKIVPFGHSLENNCQTPLTNAQNDIKEALLDALTHGVPSAPDDKGFVVQMRADTTTLQNDLAALTTGLNTLNTTSVPDSKYQALYDGCVKDVKSEIALLSSSSALPFPAVVVSLTGKQSDSTIQLLQDAAAVASGQIKINAPDGSAQTLVQQILQQVVEQNSDTKLTAEGNQLKADADNTLIDNLSPFRADPSLLA